MAAPKGNTFYKQRDKTGRDRLFSSPGDLYKAAIKYFYWCDKNPWIKIDYKGSPLTEVKIPIARPYTLRGLCIFLGVGSNYFTQFKKSIKYKVSIGSDKMAIDFNDVIKMIEDVIYTQKFEGAAVGAFNANIISRDLGLIDKSAVNMNFDKMAEEDLDKIIDRLTNNTLDNE